MNTIIEYLRSKSYWDFFAPSERSSPLRFTYTALLEAFSEGADRFVLRKSYLAWYKGDSVLGRFPETDFVAPDPSYNFYFHQILERDSVLQSHLTIVSEGPNETVVIISE